MRKASILLNIILFLFCCSTLQAQQWGDYTLYSVMNSSNAYLVDTTGTNYHTWTFAANKKTGYSTYMLSGGDLVRSVSNQGNQLNGGGMTGAVQKVDWSGNVLWDYVYSTANYCLHHDICPMPNGNVLMISYEVKTAAEATQAGSSQNIVIWPDKIIEVQQTGATTGTIVWEWHAWDHLVQNVDQTKDNYYPSIVDHPELLNINYQTTKDWMHMNGLDYNANLDQITFSSHALNEIYVIDHSTTTLEAAGHTGGNSGKGGDLLYRWGNPAVYSAAGTNVFHTVHDAHFVPEDCPHHGDLVGYNNNGISNNQSCVDRIIPPRSGYNYTITPGSAYLPANYTSRHACNGHNNNMGNSQQLPNGNILVCVAQSGLIYEADSNGNTLWSKTITGTVPQAFRYTACYTSGTNPTVTASAANLTICEGDAVQLDATAAGGSSYTYQWSSIPAGFSSTIQNPVVNPTTNTSYTVVVNSGGCTANSSVSITVNPLPATPTISQSGNVLTASTVGTTYVWYLNGVVIPSATSQTYSPTQSGNYTVQVVDANGCTSLTSVEFAYTNTAISSEYNSESLQVSPNPTNGILNITGEVLQKGSFTIRIFDTCGKLALEAQNLSTLDVSNLNNGIYSLTVNTADNRLFSQKIVVIQ